MWLTYALLSAIFAALVAIFAKVGLQKIDTNVATAIRSIVMAIFLFSVIFFQGKITLIKSIIEDHKAFSFIILSGIAGAMSWLFYFLALKDGKVSQIVPIDRLSVVFAMILAMLFLGEKVSARGMIGIVLIVVGGIMIALYN